MIECDVIFSEEEPGTAPGTTVRGKLLSAWVYWREQGKFQVLRADADGAVRKFGKGDATRPDAYTERFTSTVGAAVEVFHSKGAKPLREEQVKPSLLKRVVPESFAASVRKAEIHASPGGVVNTIRSPILAEIRLPMHRIALTTPGEEPSLLPVLWELLDEPTTPTAALDQYYTMGLDQGAAIPPNNDGPVGTAAPAAPEQVRRRARGLPLAGTIPAASTGVKISLLDETGKVVRLLSDGSNAASAKVDELDGKLGAPQGEVRPFTATLFLAADTFLGAAQLLIKPQGVTPPVADAFFHHLVGTQMALVDDFPAAPDGQTPGSPSSASDEIRVVEYSSTPIRGPHEEKTGPHPTAATLRAGRRMGRMVEYSIVAVNEREIPLVAVAAPSGSGRTAMPAGTGRVLSPQMPLWTPELQLVGLNRSALEDLLCRRKLMGLPGDELRIAFDWELTIAWKGPDRDAPGAYVQPDEVLSGSQTAVLRMDENADVSKRKLRGVSAGIVENALEPAPPQIPFPARRRLPVVRIADAGANVRRHWSWVRAASDAERDSLVIEWQPVMSDDHTVAGNPRMRGGNGIMTLTNLQLGGRAVAPGVVFPRPPRTAAAPASGGGPVDRLPRFRIVGRNPPEASVLSMIGALTEAAFRARVGREDALALVPLNVWIATARGVVGHETQNQQFRETQAERRINSGSTITLTHGNERNAPKFGSPHGYGVGQLDPPTGDGDPVAAGSDRVWAIDENARKSIQVMFDKALEALRFLKRKSPAGLEFNKPNLVTTSTRRQRAVLHRETARRYNGGSEFKFEGGDWIISPSGPQRDEKTIGYPNDVLGTGVNYGPLTGVTNTASTAFLEAHFFPGIP